jgi:hypothetical protein
MPEEWSLHLHRAGSLKLYLIKFEIILTDQKYCVNESLVNKMFSSPAFGNSLPRRTYLTIPKWRYYSSLVVECNWRPKENNKEGYIAGRGKGKVVRVLIMKVTNIGILAPVIFNLATRWRWAVRVALWPTSSPVPIECKAGCVPVQVLTVWTRGTLFFFHFLWINPQTLQPIALSL